MLPRFFVPTAPGESNRIELPSDEAHHLRHVLRLRAGAALEVFDGRGRAWTARVHAVDRRRVLVDLIDVSDPPPEPRVHVTLMAGLLKGDQMDAVVRDATMLGVRAVAPVITEHVAVPRRVWIGGGALRRWQRVAIASAKQCGRAVVPDIAPVVPLDLRAASLGCDLVAMSVEPAQARAHAVAAVRGPGPAPSSVLALTGPEGGWSEAELDLAVSVGAQLVTLGPRTLRAEIAPAVLLSSLWHAWGW